MTVIFSTQTLNHDNAVQAIVHAHGQTFGLPAQDTGPAPSVGPDVYRAAKQACQLMGFIDIDAECLALAWQKQTERTGRFDAMQWPVEGLDFGIIALPRTHGFAPCPKQLGLYAVLPDAAWVGRMARAGVPTVQLRFKSEDPAAIAREVRAAVQAVQDTDALLFINDHWQAAIDAGAYGVHLGQEDLDTADLRAIRQAGMRLGLSTHGYAEMCRADAFAPSYIAMGAVFPTTLKRMVTAAQGTGRLGAYAQLLREYPLVAIGGIDTAHLPQVMATGVGSVAVVRALIAASDPEAEVITFKEAIRMSKPENHLKSTL